MRKLNDNIELTWVSIGELKVQKIVQSQHKGSNICTHTTYCINLKNNRPKLTQIHILYLVHYM